MTDDVKLHPGVIGSWRFTCWLEVVRHQPEPNRDPHLPPSRSLFWRDYVQIAGLPLEGDLINLLNDPDETGVLFGHGQVDNRVRSRVLQYNGDWHLSMTPIHIDPPQTNDWEMAIGSGGITAWWTDRDGIDQPPLEERLDAAGWNEYL